MSLASALGISEEQLFNIKTCNLDTCRYNQDGQCGNEQAREECIEVCSKVLCMENTENSNRE